jgi:hypothetical protein
MPDAFEFFRIYFAARPLFLWAAVMALLLVGRKSGRLG